MYILKQMKHTHLEKIVKVGSLSHIYNALFKGLTSISQVVQKEVKLQRPKGM